MTIRHLKIFIEVAKTGNMSEAANLFFISQPTVSQAIKDLEEEYGVLLFERRPKKLVLTKEGEYLLQTATSVVDGFDQIGTDMKRLKDKDRLRIGGTISVGNSIINDLVHEFHKQLPGIDTFVCVNNTETLEQMILKNELDVAIVEGEVYDKKILVIPAVKDYLVLVCNRNHPYSRQRLIPFHDIENQRFHLREKGSGTRKLFENFCLRNKIEINCVFESNCPSAIKKSILENDNLSVISIRLVEDEIRKGTLHAIKPAGEEWQRYFSIIYHKDKVPDEPLKIFMRIVKNFPDDLDAEEKRFSILCPKIEGEVSCNIE